MQSCEDGGQIEQLFDKVVAIQNNGEFVDERVTNYDECDLLAEREVDLGVVQQKQYKRVAQNARD